MWNFNPFAKLAKQIAEEDGGSLGRHTVRSTFFQKLLAACRIFLGSSIFKLREPTSDSATPVDMNKWDRESVSADLTHDAHIGLSDYLTLFIPKLIIAGLMSWYRKEAEKNVHRDSTLSMTLLWCAIIISAFQLLLSSLLTVICIPVIAIVHGIAHLKYQEKAKELFKKVDSTNNEEKNLIISGSNIFENIKLYDGNDGSHMTRYPSNHNRQYTLFNSSSLIKMLNKKNFSIVFNDTLKDIPTVLQSKKWVLLEGLAPIPASTVGLGGFVHRNYTFVDSYHFLSFNYRLKGRAAFRLFWELNGTSKVKPFLQPEKDENVNKMLNTFFMFCQRNRDAKHTFEIPLDIIREIAAHTVDDGCEIPLQERRAILFELKPVMKN